MEIALQIINYVMWFFIAVYLIVGVPAIVLNNKNEKRIWGICAMITAGIIFAISVVRLLMAIDLGKELGQYIVFLPAWLYASFMQLYYFKKNCE